MLTLMERVAETGRRADGKVLRQARKSPIDEIEGVHPQGVPLRTAWFRLSAVLLIKNKGVQKLLDAVVDYMPSPLDIPAIKGMNPETGEEVKTVIPLIQNRSRLWHLRSLTDPFVGKLCFFRVYSGTVDAGSTVLQLNQGQERAYRTYPSDALQPAERISKLSMLVISLLLVGLKNTTTGDTLCDEKHPIILESMEFPEPVIQLCYRAEDQGWSGKDGHRSGKAGRRRPDLQRPIPMRKPVRPSSPVWASCTWKSSLTVCCVNSR